MSRTDRHPDRPTDHRGRFVPDGSWPPGRGAPEPLERVRRFLNTANPESGADHFETPASLASWLDREGYGGYGGCRVTERDQGRTVLLRHALRELAIANHEGGAHQAAEALRLVDELAVGLPVVVRLSRGPSLVPASTGVDAALAGLLAAVHDAMVAGTWSRLKACRNHHCRWVFYDHSRNGSGAWCSELACGSRMKVRAYRARQRSRRSVTPLVTQEAP